MWFINRYITSAFDAVFSVMEGWPGWLSLTVLSALTGVVALVIYKYTSNQSAIGRVHDDIRAALLAAKLFKDDLGVTLRSQGKLFGGAGRLLFHSLIPLAVMMIPITLLLTQMAPRYEWRPLNVGDEFLLYIELQPGTLASEPSIALEANGVEVLEGPARFEQKKYKEYAAIDKLCWALRATENGRNPLTIRVGDETAVKDLVVSDWPYHKTCPVRPGTSFADQLLFAVEKPASDSDTIQKISIDDLPAGSTPFFGWNVHWAISWLVLSMAFGLLVKPIIKVQMW